MPLGPIELVAVKFPGNQFKGEIAPAIQELVDTGTIRIVDILFLYKGPEGEVKVIEINELENEDFGTFDPIVADLTGLLSPDDVHAVAAGLENDSSAALLVFEDTWAVRLRDAILNAGGRLIMAERIPGLVVEQVLAEAAAAEAEAQAETAGVS